MAIYDKKDSVNTCKTLQNQGTYTYVCLNESDWSISKQTNKSDWSFTKKNLYMGPPHIIGLHSVSETLVDSDTI